jgi:flagellar motor switch protein FliM
VLKMRSGDVITLDVADDITASVDGIPIMECKYGVFNNQYALKIVKMLTTNEGESHD